MIVVFEVPLDEDLSGFTQQLWSLKITHRVVFEQTQQLIVNDEQSAEVVAVLYDHWQGKGEIPEALEQQLFEQRTSKNVQASKARIDYKKIPVVITLLISSALLSLLVDFGSNTEFLKYFTITEFELAGRQLNYFSLDHNFETLELWRFVSPVFIHFSIAHLVFNALWIWVVGSVVERHQGSGYLLVITVFAGISSNIGQYYVSGPVFGGLSGAVYALISYAWIWDKLNVNKLSIVSNALMGFMVVWLVLGYSGLLSQLGFGAIANTAHLVGLVCGLATALIAYALKRNTVLR